MSDLNSKDSGIDWAIIDFKRPLSEKEKVAFRLLLLLLVAFVSTAIVLAVR